MTRIAVLQMTSGIDPDRNTEAMLEGVSKAAAEGASMLFTPEMCGLLDRNRTRAAQHIVREEECGVLAAMCEAAARHDIWIALGSLALANEGKGRWSNRSLLLAPDGSITARYDKVHMFDVELSTGESWRESNAYAPGEEIVTAPTPIGRLGFSICYDVRFPALYDELGNRGCDAIAIPAAFTVPTGKDHWHVLLRARAIEASAYVIAAAQVGKHEDGRSTYGHSLVIDPWGDVIMELDGERPGIGFAEINDARIAEIREQIPSLANRRPIPKSVIS